MPLVSALLLAVACAAVACTGHPASAAPCIEARQATITGVYDVTYSLAKTRSLFDDSPANTEACARLAMTSILFGHLGTDPRPLNLTDNGNGTVTEDLSKEATGRVFPQRVGQRVILVERYLSDGYNEGGRYELDVDEAGTMTGEMVDTRMPSDIQRGCEFTFAVRGKRR